MSKQFVCYDEEPDHGQRGTTITATDASAAAEDYLRRTYSKDLCEETNVYVREYGTKDVLRVSCSVRMVLEVEVADRPLRVQGLFDDGSQVPGETTEERERRVWSAQTCELPAGDRHE